MAKPVVDTGDLTRLKGDLKSAAGKVGAGKMLRRAHKDTAKVVEPLARSKASGGTAQQSAAARAIAAQGLQNSAVLAIKNTAGVPFGIGAFVGAKFKAQFPEWVGNQYVPGDSPSAGPYQVREALYESKDKVAEQWELAIAEAMAEAGLDATDGPLR